MGSKGSADSRKIHKKPGCKLPTLSTCMELAGSLQIQVVLAARFYKDCLKILYFTCAYMYLVRTSFQAYLIYDLDLLKKILITVANFLIL